MARLRYFNKKSIISQWQNHNNGASAAILPSSAAPIGAHRTMPVKELEDLPERGYTTSSFSKDRHAR